MTLKEIDNLPQIIYRSWGKTYRLTAKRIRTGWKVGYVWKEHALYYATGETLQEAFGRLKTLLAH